MGKKKNKQRDRRRNEMADARGPSLLGSLLGQKPQNQFLAGALVGAAALYVLSDEEMRGRLMRGAMLVYGNIAGGVEEMREQMEDIRAELEAATGEQGDA